MHINYDRKHRGKEINIQIRETYRTPNIYDRNINSRYHVILKVPEDQHKHKILEAVTERHKPHIKVSPLGL